LKRLLIKIQKFLDYQK